MRRVSAVMTTVGTSQHLSAVDESGKESYHFFARDEVAASALEFSRNGTKTDPIRGEERTDQIVIEVRPNASIRFLADGSPSLLVPNSILLFSEQVIKLYRVVDDDLAAYLPSKPQNPKPPRFCFDCNIS